MTTYTRAFTLKNMKNSDQRPAITASANWTLAQMIEYRAQRAAERAATAKRQRERSSPDNGEGK